MSNIMYNMNKKVTAREFLHQFSKLEKQLAPGESLTVTRRGTPVGKFVKEATHTAIKLPDFEKDASRPGFDTKVGDQLLARMLRDEAIS
jgi:antitoxin (DNA-binding transcriptional repressor) of toxin-antitoxin stability system